MQIRHTVAVRLRAGFRMGQGMTEGRLLDWVDGRHGPHHVRAVHVHQVVHRFEDVGGGAAAVHGKNQPVDNVNLLADDLVD